MTVLFILVPVSLFLSALALFAFLWTLRAAQYEDLEGDAWRILSQDVEPQTVSGPDAPSAGSGLGQGRADGPAPVKEVAQLARVDRLGDQR